MNITTRAKAIEAGLVRYYTGKPCKRGHLSERWVSTCCCIECAITASKTYYRANSEKHKRSVLKWRREHPVQCREQQKKWRDAHQELLTEQRREKYKKNPERWKFASRRYRKEHPDRVKEQLQRWHEKNPDYGHRRHIAQWKQRQEERVKELGRPKPTACECCGRKVKKICWDHDHKTGRGRGWICQSCNFALGHTGDDPVRLRQLLKYLERQRAASEANHGENLSLALEHVS
jgi:hypothetical protein